MTKRLVLGEGPDSKPEPDKIRIDVVKKWSDIHHDLNNGLPEEVFDYTFDYIEAHHCFEHIESGRILEQIMNGLYDLLNEGGILDITVPYWKSDSAVECIQHCRFFNENSFMNYYSNPYAGEMEMAQFKLITNELRPHGDHLEVHVVLSK